MELKPGNIYAVKKHFINSLIHSEGVVDYYWPFKEDVAIGVIKKLHNNWMDFIGIEDNKTHYLPKCCVYSGPYDLLNSSHRDTLHIEQSKVYDIYKLCKQIQREESEIEETNKLEEDMRSIKIPELESVETNELVEEPKIIKRNKYLLL